MAGAALAPPGTASLAGEQVHQVDAELAFLVYGLRHRLARRATGGGQPSFWALRPPADPLQALRAGWPVAQIVDEVVYQPLQRTAQEAMAAHLRAALPRPRGLVWYGQHDVAWIAAVDVHRRLCDPRLSPADEMLVDLWARIVRACGCWWPRDEVCVIAERPALICTEPAGSNDEVRLHSEHGPAMGYRDGWSIHAWHGTRVPAWAVEAHTAELIGAEPNVEVRRCAIERLGWPTYIEQAALALVARARDPGNAGNELLLYDLPIQPWSRPSRVLLAVNGSIERDGTHRRYGLNVPAWFDDPLAAAGWSYGLSGHQYAQLQRRT